MDSLNSHPRVAVYDELLLRDVPKQTEHRGTWGRTDQLFFESYLARHRRYPLNAARTVWLWRYLRQVFEEPVETAAVGIKLMYDQLWRNPAVFGYAVRHQVRLVHLRRYNLLDIVLSEEASAARGRPHALTGEAIESVQIEVDPVSVVARMAQLERRAAVTSLALRAMPTPCIDVTYEDLVAEPDSLSMILAFLGISGREARLPLESRFQKLNPTDRADLVINIDALTHALRDTRFAVFL